MLLFLWLLYRGLIKGGAYENGLLIPGMISSVQPLELIALADMRSDETTYVTPQWGCKKIEPEALPLHTLQVGEKVPVWRCSVWQEMACAIISNPVR